MAIRRSKLDGARQVVLGTEHALLAEGLDPLIVASDK